MGILRLSRQNAAQTEVAQFHIVVLVKEDIAGFEVSVQNYVLLVLSFAVTLAQRKEDLHEYLPDDIFGDEVLFCSALLNELRHVSVLAVFHYDVQLLLLFKDDPRQINSSG